MGINHRCAHILVPQQLLDRSNIITILKQMSSEAVPECMARHVLNKPGLCHCLFYSLLDKGFMYMMTALLPCFAIPPATFLQRYWGQVLQYYIPASRLRRVSTRLIARLMLV